MTEASDVWDYIGKLQQQSQARRKKSPTHFSVKEDIYQQLPFFTCSNHILDADCQHDIAKYIYCCDTGVPVYGGAYNQQPQIWISKHFVIKTALTLRDSMHQKEMT